MHDGSATGEDEEGRKKKKDHGLGAALVGITVAREEKKKGKIGASRARSREGRA